MGYTDDEKRAYYARKQREFRSTPKGKLHVRKMNLKKYGLSPHDYDRIFAEQGGVCGACHQPETGRNNYGPCSLAVDHDHDTGEIRGLLCMACNRALGLIGDSLDRVLKMAIYLEAHKEVTPYE